MTFFPHTLTPWTQRENNPRNVASTIPKGGAYPVAVFADADDAAFAVHAANCHADMLALLKDLIAIEGPQPGTSDWARKVKAFIAKAEGRAP